MASSLVVGVVGAFLYHIRLVSEPCVHPISLLDAGLACAARFTPINESSYSYLLRYLCHLVRCLYCRLGASACWLGLDIGELPGTIGMASTYITVVKPSSAVIMAACIVLLQAISSLL